MDKATVKWVAGEFGAEVLDKDDMAKRAATKDMDFISEEDTGKLQIRAPVVTVMGHVDHGKVRATF